MKYFLLINVKMSTIMRTKNSIIGISEPEKRQNFLTFLYLCTFDISCSAELSMKNVLYILKIIFQPISKKWDTYRN